MKFKKGDIVVNCLGSIVEIAGVDSEVVIDGLALRRQSYILRSERYLFSESIKFYDSNFTKVGVL